MQIASIDPRDVTIEIDRPTYRVHFTSGHVTDDYQLTDAESVDAVLRWAAVTSAGRAYEVYLAMPTDDGVTLATLHRAASSGQTTPVDEQVAAYNAHDLERFAACYSPDVVIASGDGTTLIEGVEQLREQYAATFARQPNAEIRNRMSVGDWTVDHEAVTAGDRRREVLVAYRTGSGRITRAVMLG